MFEFEFHRNQVYNTKVQIFQAGQNVLKKSPDFYSGFTKLFQIKLGDFLKLCCLFRKYEFLMKSYRVMVFQVQQNT